MNELIKSDFDQRTEMFRIFTVESFYALDSRIGTRKGCVDIGALPNAVLYPPKTPNLTTFLHLPRGQ